ncbi:MAG: guanylate kinase [Burkholderiales bacterium]|nr:guanylate kinase [Burkholderiales bacterium]
MTGLLFVVSAPSGAGKSSLVSAALASDARLALSVSYTTRAPRAGEQDGREYHFVVADTFRAIQARGDFLESAEVHGNLYGTSRTQIDVLRTAGQDVLLEIDWQGAAQVRRIFPDAIGIFILPPSVAELERRLRARGQDSEAVIRRRLDAAAGEIGHAREFDYVIINSEFDAARQDLCAVVRACRLRLPQQQAAHPELFRID